ncbi:carboxymuconolactone decarboxylase family protein [Tritonibacter litoralis]|nr:carboxymuconolactone decarboxylase family protein [Tritonibacter litoralis]
MKQIEPKDTDVQTEAAYEEAKRQFGGVINLFKVAGNAPNVLSGVLALNKSMNEGIELTARQTELVAMLVSALNRCDYCVNVHMQVGTGAGVSKEDMLAAMAGQAADVTEQALLDFTNEVVRHRGIVSDDTFKSAKQAGFTDKALLEVVGVIGFYTTLQYIRHVGDPEHDFPMVESFDAHVHGANIEKASQIA